MHSFKTILDINKTNVAILALFAFKIRIQRFLYINNEEFFLIITNRMCKMRKAY